MRRVAPHQLLIILACLGMANAAAAETVQSRREIFERARVQIQHEEWDSARTLLLQLWRERSTYDVALQLGQVEYNLGLHRDAAAHIAEGLVMLPPREPLETGERSRQILSLCRERLGTLQLEVENKAAEVLVDGQVVGTAPLATDLFVLPGTHQFAVRLPGHRAETWAQGFVAGQTESRRVKLTALERSGVLLTTPTGTQPSHTTLERSLAPLVAGGVIAVVGLSTGVAMQLMRSSRESEADRIRDRVGPSGCASPSANQSDCDRLVALSADYDAYGRIELLSFLLGGAALIGTGAYFLATRHDPVAPSNARKATPLAWNASLSPRHSHVALAVAF